MRALTIVPLVLPLALFSCGPRGAATRSSAPSTLSAELRQVAEALASRAPQPEASAETRGAGASDRVTASGEFVSPVRSELAPRLPGRVGRILADAGDRVGQGQALLELETEYLTLDLQRAEADLRRAQAAAEEAKRDFDRKTELIAKESVSAAVYERSRAAHAQAEAARSVAETGLALARQRLEDAVLRAPIDGVVMERRTDVGERLGDQSVAFVIVQTAPLKLRFKLPERYLPSVARGQRVRASVDIFPTESFEGVVSAVVKAVEAASRTFAVEAEFANRDGRLYPGLFARVELDLGGDGRVAAAR